MDRKYWEQFFNLPEGSLVKSERKTLKYKRITGLPPFDLSPADYPEEVNRVLLEGDGKPNNVKGLRARFYDK